MCQQPSPTPIVCPAAREHPGVMLCTECESAARQRSLCVICRGAGHIVVVTVPPRVQVRAPLVCCCVFAYMFAVAGMGCIIYALHGYPLPLLGTFIVLFVLCIGCHRQR